MQKLIDTVPFFATAALVPLTKLTKVDQTFGKQRRPPLTKLTKAKDLLISSVLSCPNYSEIETFGRALVSGPVHLRDVHPKSLVQPICRLDVGAMQQKRYFLTPVPQ
jgi:hypothetical protein